MKKNHINLFKRECVKCLLDFKILNIKNNINVYLCNTSYKKLWWKYDNDNGGK